MKHPHWFFAILTAVVAAFLLSISHAADNFTVYDYNRQQTTIAAKDISNVYFPKRILYDETGTALKTEGAVLQVVPHRHSSSGTLHFAIDDVTSDYRCILVDLSDTTNWPHSETHEIHIEYIDAQVDSDTNGQYRISLVFLEDCSASDCDSYSFWRASGSKSTGNNMEAQIGWGRNGPTLGSAHVVTSISTADDTNYQTDVQLCDIFSPGAPTTYPGNGDLIVFVDWIAGTFDLDLNISYHTHSATH